MTGYYAATSTNIHVRVHFNLTQVFKTKQNKLLAETYLQLEIKHEKPFKSVVKSTTDVSSMIIENSQEKFHDIIQSTYTNVKVFNTRQAIANHGTWSFNHNDCHVFLQQLPDQKSRNLKETCRRFPPP
jgi:hypothetical protein